MTETIGLVAAFLTTAAFLPQAILTLRTGNTSGISLAMYAVLNIGLVAWLAYGLMLGALPIIAANTVTILFTTPILVLKLRHVLAGRG